MDMNRLERIKGCLLGGAVGDALGAPVEFLEWSVIEARFGPQGIIDFVPAYGITGAITDDTQMMLFTAEGLIRAYVRGSSRGVATSLALSIIHYCAG
jgi:ADP-ribosylglycohydrolase